MGLSPNRGTMRLITINRTRPNASIELYGCPMQCKYCSHTSAQFKDYDLDKVVQAMSDNGIRSVFLGGAEPAMHRKEALDLIRILHGRGKEVILKTTGADPEFLAATKGKVTRYILEVKAPLDDPQLLTVVTSLPLEKAREQQENVRRSLTVLEGQKVRAVLRLIPGRYTVEAVERMAEDLAGHVDELVIAQFLSSDSDVSYSGITTPSPDQATMMAFGQAARRHLPRVKVKGSGFDIVL